jgi:drug/metabolite transporter (DMT)-like permease
MWKALLFAGIAALGNALFVFGQRRAPVSHNPFLFTAGAVSVCTIGFLAAALIFRTQGDQSYIYNQRSSILVSGLGFFITFVGFYLLYSRFGAVYYAVYAALSILTTSVGVGVLLFKEGLNYFQIAALVLAIIAIALFSYGGSIPK